jgi:stage V sporulation protein S
MGGYFSAENQYQLTYSAAFRLSSTVFSGIKKELSFMKVLKVSANSAPNAVAGAISSSVKEDNETEVQAIGAAAINQAVKAIAVSRGFLTPSGIDIYCQPSFISIDIDGTERTGIRFAVKQLP